MSKMHLLILAFTLFLFEVAAKVSLRFSNARDFYHDLGEEAMQFLFQTISLNPKHIQILGQLLADSKFNIQEVYNDVCSLMHKDRAITLLSLICDHKNLEMLFFGPKCLSQTIIDARKAIPRMWPPSGFPLLTRDFIPNGMATNDIRDILEEALKQPEWWQTSRWANHVKWDELNGWRFWRMLTFNIFTNDDFLRSCLKNSLFQISIRPTFEDLEMLLMKAIRNTDFSDISKPTSSIRKSPVKTFIHDLFLKKTKRKPRNQTAFLERFSHLQDPWSIKALGVIQALFANKYGRSRIILDSKLLQLASWQAGPVDMRTATNDIFELLTNAAANVVSPKEKEEISDSFTPFLNSIPDWSIVRPQVLRKAINSLDGKFNYIFIPYVDQMLRNPSAFNALPEWLLACSTNFKAYRTLFKRRGPLRTYFASIKPHLLANYVPPYMKVLYRKWVQHKKNWPSIMAVHESLKHKIIMKLFNPSESDYGTYDPKTDRDYENGEWELAFLMIRFQVEYGVPASVVPSICFLQALLCYKRRTPFNWVELEAIKECSFPKSKERQDRYLVALTVASYCFNSSPPWPWFSIVSAQFLQNLFRGFDNDDTENEKAVDNLSRRVKALTL